MSFPSIYVNTYDFRLIKLEREPNDSTCIPGRYELRVLDEQGEEVYSKNTAGEFAACKLLNSMRNDLGGLTDIISRRGGSPRLNPEYFKQGRYVCAYDFSVLDRAAMLELASANCKTLRAEIALGQQGEQSSLRIRCAASGLEVWRMTADSYNIATSSMFNNTENDPNKPAQYRWAVSMKGVYLWVDLPWRVNDVIEEMQWKTKEQRRLAYVAPLKDHIERGSLVKRTGGKPGEYILMTNSSNKAGEILGQARVVGGLVMPDGNRWGDEEAKAKYQALQDRLAELSNKFDTLRYSHVKVFTLPDGWDERSLRPYQSKYVPDGDDDDDLLTF